jgi:hypothetical protein
MRNRCSAASQAMQESPFLATENLLKSLYAKHLGPQIRKGISRPAALPLPLQQLEVADSNQALLMPLRASVNSTYIELIMLRRRYSSAIITPLSERRG